MLRGLMVSCAALMSLQAQAQMNTQIYGYIDGYVEKVDDTPVIGSSQRSANPSEFNVPNLHMIIMSSKDSYKSFLNISGAGAGALDVRNAWVEKELLGEKLAFRIGKLYRRFGLYNEILDAVPTYIGIEPPEMFDNDHLLLTRTTNAMLHGRTELGEGNFLNYAFTTGNDERLSDATPLGADVHYTVGSNWKIGASYYTSGGDAVSSNQGGGVGSGGVLSWMERSNYMVQGAYVQYTDAKWTIQVESFSSNHDAVRDVTRVGQLCTGDNFATLNQRQRDRFNCAGGPGNYNANGDYKVQTSYIRAGYNVPLSSGGMITPYLQYDLYENEEVIWKKSLGGDNEAGLADDGQFAKATAGLVYRPDFNVAIKADYSQHLQQVNGEQANYGEVRFSFSYFWSL